MRKTRRTAVWPDIQSTNLYNFCTVGWVSKKIIIIGRNYLRLAVFAQVWQCDGLIAQLIYQLRSTSGTTANPKPNLKDRQLVRHTVTLAILPRVNSPKMGVTDCYGVRHTVTQKRHFVTDCYRVCDGLCNRYLQIRNTRCFHPDAAIPALLFAAVALYGWLNSKFCHGICKLNCVGVLLAFQTHISQAA